MNIQIRTGLSALSGSLRSASRDLERALADAGEKTAEAVIEAAKESALHNLPRKGGLNRRVANAKFTIQHRRTAAGGRVRAVVSSSDALVQIDRRGVIAHPVFGNREVWVRQRDPQSKHFLTTPAKTVGATVGEREFTKAIARAVRRIGRAW